MNTVLITGGTGALGSVLVRRLAELGNQVRVLTLPGDKNAPALQRSGLDIRFGDVSRKEDLRGVCEGVSTVLHCAAIIITDNESLYTSINAGGTRNMVEEATAAGVSHFIHISSASVVYPKPTAYSISKRIAEEEVRQSRLSWSIVRPTLVYGKKGGQEFDMYLDYLKRFPVVPFIGCGGAIKRPVYVEDLVNGLVKIACLLRGKNGIYNLSGKTSISMIDFARLCLVLQGKGNKPFIHLPVGLCRLLAAAMKRCMKNPPLKWSVIAGITQDADLDPSDAIRDIVVQRRLLYRGENTKPPANP
jgi:nucleoside-diphosphate-sugar epimerase